MADTSQSILRRLSDLYSNPRGSLEQLVDQLNNFNKGRVAVINDRGAGYRNLSQEERVKQIVQGALDNVGSGGIGALGVIKTKGGNWLTGSVENALKGLKRRMDPELEGYARRGQNLMPHEAADVVPKISLNDWIEGPLTKYVKRDMATEGDPVRKLAEQGILHSNDVELWGRNFVHPSGEHYEKLAKNPMAQAWENASDNMLRSEPASTYQNFGSSNLGEEWVNKLDPGTPFYLPKDNTVGVNLGFGHLTDELYNALNPESGLPRHLLLAPEQMQQMGMEKAVRHVDAINKWRAAQQAEANAKLAQSPAVHLVREYAENNPKGLRWVEIKSSGKMELPEGYTVEPNSTYLGKTGYQLRTPEGARLGLPQETEEAALAELQGRKIDKALQEQLKYEGDTMGHCVGGYCDEVASGKSRIFSLRDAKGQPHVTIEVDPRGGSYDIGGIDGLINQLSGEEYTQLKGALGGKDPYLQVPQNEVRKAIYGIRPDILPIPSIVQIKGKQNLKPKDEYLPFVQDFVRNHPEGGKWGDIGDLNNAGLYRHHVSKYPESVKDLGEYASKEDIENWVANNVKPTPGFAQGGSVQGNTTWRPMELDGIIGYITE